MTDITINAESASIETTYNSRQVEISLTNLDLPALLEQLDVIDIIQHFGAMELLDEIVEWQGRDDILNHLDATEAP